MSLNRVLFLKINGLSGSYPFLNKVAMFSAQYLIFIVPIYLLYLWFKKSEKGDEIKNKALLLFTAAMISWFFSFLISSLYFHPRPFMLHPPPWEKIDSSCSRCFFPKRSHNCSVSAQFHLFFLRRNNGGNCFSCSSFFCWLCKSLLRNSFPLRYFRRGCHRLDWSGINLHSQKTACSCFQLVYSSLV